MNNVDILIARRPKTTMGQFREMACKTDKEFILFTDDDAVFTDETKRLIASPDNLYLDLKYDVLRFRWLNEKNKQATGIAFYRVSALRKINLNRIPSIGADATMQELLPTTLSDTFAFTHSLKTNFKTYFRWGKGRAYCYRLTRQKNITRTLMFNFMSRLTKKHTDEVIRTDLNIRYLWAYFGYITGYVWGFIVPIKDEHWK